VKYLIDTNAWIFFFEDSPKLNETVAQVLENPDSHCYVSIASVWEASIKVAIGKLQLGYDLKKDLPRILEENGFQLLPIEFEDAVGVHSLPPHHGDPFDRIQIVQAQRRNLTILSHDTGLDAYNLPRIG
jgi:PIN domain nuclease of toxin-antitoxin system